jgi:predicted nucleic acid-binding protein
MLNLLFRQHGWVPQDFNDPRARTKTRPTTSLTSAGTSLDVPDLLIAAAAREHGCTLATRNKNEFDKQPIHELLSVDIIQ